MALCFFEWQYQNIEDIPDEMIEAFRARKNYTLRGYAGKYIFAGQVCHVFMVDEETVPLLAENGWLKLKE